MCSSDLKKIFDEASAMCEKILTEHADQLRAIAEYLLEHETMEAEEFNYFFEHGEFMPLPPKELRKVREDKSIERPAKKISMTDGYAEGDETAETQAAEGTPVAEPAEDSPATEPPTDEKMDNE